MKAYSRISIAVTYVHTASEASISLTHYYYVHSLNAMPPATHIAYSLPESLDDNL